MKKIIYILFLFAAIQEQSFGQKLSATVADALITVNVINEKNKAQPGETVIFESQTTKKNL